MNNQDRLQQAATQLELPTIRAVRLLHRGAVDTFAVDFHEGPAAWMRVARGGVGLPALVNEQTALNRLWTLAHPHLPSTYRLTRVGPVPVSAHLALEGALGTQVLGTPEAEAVTASVGRWIGELPAFDVHHGSVGDGSTFRPRAADWSAELALELADCRATLAQAGLGLGTHEDRLAAAVEAVLGYVPVEAFAVVHRDLAPDRFTQRGGALVGVFGWERAWLADPLYQWAPLLLQPTHVVGTLLEAAGASGAAVLAPENQARLVAYTSLEVLARTANKVRTILPAGHLFLARAQALAVDEAERLQRIPEQLEHARKHERPMWTGWVADEADIVLRRVLRLVGERNRLLGDQLEDALASALVARRLQGPVRERWLKLALALLEELEEVWQAPWPPIELELTELPAEGQTRWAARAELLYREALEVVSGVDPAVHTGIAVRQNMLRSRDHQSTCGSNERLGHTLAQVALQPDPEGIQALKELFELATGLAPREVRSFAELAEQVSPPRATALLAAAALVHHDLPVSPWVIVGEIGR